MDASSKTVLLSRYVAPEWQVNEAGTAVMAKPETSPIAPCWRAAKPSQKRRFTDEIASDYGSLRSPAIPYSAPASAAQSADCGKNGMTCAPMKTPTYTSACNPRIAASTA